MEIFSCMLNSVQAMGKIKTPFSKGNLNINHVMYADDVMIFITPDIESVAGIKDCLQSFKLISSLDFNVQKSEAFLSGTTEQLKNQICASLCINEGSLPIKYLGLPLITKRLSSQDCQPLLTKIRRRLGMWNNKKLSRAGRIELNKAVLTSFQIYWSATYNIPMEILLEIEKIWFKVKYLKKSNFWNRPMPSNPAWGVRSIFNCRDLAKSYLCYCVGKGRDIDFWTDPWHPDGPVQSLTSEGELYCITKKISIEYQLGTKVKLDVLRFLGSRLSRIKAISLDTASPPGKQCTTDAVLGTGSSSSAQTETSVVFSVKLSLNLKNCGSGKSLKGMGRPPRLCGLVSVWWYTIWRERNSPLHGKPPCHKTSTLQRCIRLIHSRLAHHQLGDDMSRKNVATAANFGLPSFQVKTDAVFCSWTRPEHSFIKLNTDATVHNGKGGIGGLIRNSAGEVHVMFSIRLGCEEIHILEIKAILHGIRLLRTGGHESIWIKSDSLTAVIVILEKWECPWKAIPIVEEIRDALLKTQNWKLSHTWREANGAADFLSKPDCCCEGAALPPSSIPPKLRDILDLDAAGHIYPRL
ncbi:uncharacterized protein LOC143888524 [Tasmannia lanceolata]|uniref:uncharacterized protein LOC143888524 n=1 Tax=Tasmannia lanceolata TaxID=3420 RepID=UPI0040642967